MTGWAAPALVPETWRPMSADSAGRTSRASRALLEHINVDRTLKRESRPAIKRVESRNPPEVFSSSAEHAPSEWRGVMALSSHQRNRLDGCRRERICRLAAAEQRPKSPAPSRNQANQVLQTRVPG